MSLAANRGLRRFASAEESARLSNDAGCASNRAAYLQPPLRASGILPRVPRSLGADHWCFRFPASHGFLGAAAGCVIGQYEAKNNEKKNNQRPPSRLCGSIKRQVGHQRSLALRRMFCTAGRTRRSVRDANSADGDVGRRRRSGWRAARTNQAGIDHGATIPSRIAHFLYILANKLVGGLRMTEPLLTSASCRRNRRPGAWSYTTATPLSPTSQLHGS